MIKGHYCPCNPTEEQSKRIAFDKGCLRHGRIQLESQNAVELKIAIIGTF